MSQDNKNRGICFKNHKIDLTTIDWGMNPSDVDRVLQYPYHREAENIIGYSVPDGLEFDGNYYDADLLFFFMDNKLYKISILLDVVFDERSGGICYRTIREILANRYGPSGPEEVPGKTSARWTTTNSQITLVMSDEYYTLREELSVFGVQRRLSADFYDAPADRLIRIMLEKT